MGTSIKVALLATIVSVVLGTLIALALVRYHFRGRGATNLLIFVPLTAPEIVLGASLLALFLEPRDRPRLLDDRARAHHVLHQLRRRDGAGATRGFDRHVEEAAMDLGANEYVTFFKITLPLIAPGSSPARCSRSPVDRRLRHHELQLGHDGDVPALSGARRSASRPR